MPATDITALRKAALTLHALPEPDARRVLAQLDQSTQDAIRPLLSELSGLGIPKGRRWLADDEETNTEQSPRELVWRLTPATALRLLTAQSVDTAVTVMQIAAWPWLEEVAAAWPADQRRTVRDRLASPSVVGKLLGDELLARMVCSLGDPTLQREAHASPASPSSAAKVSEVKRPWYRGVMSLFMLT